MNSRRAHFETRYLVLNTSASTLDLERAELLALSAIVVDGGLLRSRDSFHLRFDAAAPHLSSGLQQMVQMSTDSVLVAFNAAFQRGLISAACARHLPLRTPWGREQLWLDLYFLLPALFPERRERPVRLHSWLESFAIEPAAGERSLVDAWAIAQLLLAAQVRGSEMGAHTASALVDIERTHRHNRSRI